MPVAMQIDSLSSLKPQETVSKTSNKSPLFGVAYARNLFICSESAMLSSTEVRSRKTLILSENDCFDRSESGGIGMLNEGDE